jgi:hypothetical protein
MISAQIGIIKVMSDSQTLEKTIHDLIVDLCGVLYDHGYQEISVGSLMRVIGVDPASAAKHDDNTIDLQHHFAGRSPLHRNQAIPPGTTLH